LTTQLRQLQQQNAEELLKTFLFNEDIKWQRV